MSDTPAELKNPESANPTVFTGSARWMFAVLLVLGPLLQAIEFLLESGLDDTAARVALWTETPDRTGASMASGLLAIPFLLAGIAIIVALTRSHSRRIAWLGGVFMLSAMVGLAAAHGYELAAFGFTLAGDPSGAVSILNADGLGLPGGVFFIMFIGGAVLGTLLLSAAMWRSPYVPRIVVLFTLAFAALDFAAGLGVIAHLVNLAGFIILAGAVATGYDRSLRAAAAPVTQSGS